MKSRVFSVRVVNQWNDLDLGEETVAVDTMEEFRRKLSEFGYRYILGYGDCSYINKSFLNH